MNQDVIISVTQFPAAALFWHQYGLRVIPLVPETKIPCVLWNPWLGNLSAAKIRQYWLKHPNHEVGFIVGDSYIVFDADSPESIAALAAIEKAFGIASSLIVRTTHGQHHYYRLAPGTVAKADSHSTELHPERIDVKTGPTMVVLPPSKGKSIITSKVTTAGDLIEVGQNFIDAVFEHNGRKPPRVLEIRVQTDESTPGSCVCMPLLVALLDHLNADMGHDQWLRVLMGIFYAMRGGDDGFDLADTWSRRGRKYKGTREVRAKWNSFRIDHETPVRIGTLIWMVRDTGQPWPCTCHDLEEQFETCDTVVVQPDCKSK